MVAMPWDRFLEDGPQLSVTGDDDGSVLVMAIRGSLDRTLFLRMRTMVHKSVADYPAGLIVDLTELDDPAGASAPLWLTARQTGEAMQPRVRLVLCLAPDTALAARLHQLGARWFLPIFPSVAQARAVLTGTPVLIHYAQLRLPPEPVAPSMARMLVADACRARALPQLLVAGQLVDGHLHGDGQLLRARVLHGHGHRQWCGHLHLHRDRDR